MFSSLKEIKEYLADRGYEDVIIFENPSYCTAFLGVSTCNKAVYDYNLMVEYLMLYEKMDIEDAVSLIDRDDSFINEIIILERVLIL